MAILISGSLAHDYIMDFPGRFRDHILPEKIHILNVAFSIETFKKQFGGTAGNIAYTLKLLGGNPIVLAPLGKDGWDYISRFEALGINTKHMPVLESDFTSSAHIVTDQDDNQITAFHGGIAKEAAKLSLDEIKEKIEFAILSPAYSDAMVLHARECVARAIPFVFDPGQQISALSAEQINQCLDGAAFFVSNDYELALLLKKIELSKEGLLARVPTIITTFGAKGSMIMTRQETLSVPACVVTTVADPTGAGDAYRAGFFFAHTRGLPLGDCARIGSVAASFTVETYGTQEHTFTLDTFRARFTEQYASACPI